MLMLGEVVMRVGWDDQAERLDTSERIRKSGIGTAMAIEARRRTDPPECVVWSEPRPPDGGRHTNVPGRVAGMQTRFELPSHSLLTTRKLLCATY